MYKQEDLLPEKYFISSAEIERTRSIKSAVIYKIEVWKCFLNRKKRWRAGKRSKNYGSAVKGQLFYSDLENCFSASVLVVSLVLKSGL